MIASLPRDHIDRDYIQLLWLLGGEPDNGDHHAGNPASVHFVADGSGLTHYEVANTGASREAAAGE